MAFLGVSLVGLFGIFADSPRMASGMKETGNVLAALIPIMLGATILGAAIAIIGLWQPRKQIRTVKKSN